MADTNHLCTKRRDGTHVIYEMQPGDTWAFGDGVVVICNPDHPPKIIESDGTVVEIEPLWVRP